MWKCAACGEQVEDQFEACWNCSTSKDGRPQTDSKDEDTEPEEAAPFVVQNSPSGGLPDDRSARQSAPRGALAMRAQARYEDAYLVARAVVGFGRLLKVLGVLAGVLVLVASMALSKGTGDTTGSVAFAGFALGLFIGGVFYIMGVLLSAQGQMLKATVDTSVHSSPFLTGSQKANAMSL